jgi:endonuclease YncB( thermonuclease family)
MTVVAFRVAVAIAAHAFASIATGQESCKLSAMGNVSVAAIRDGRTLLLADGRELRLAGIEAADASRTVLEAHAAGQTLRLEKLRTENDRYGRVVAFAYAGEMETSLQQAMIEQGQARVSSRVGDRACAEVMLAAERKARAARGRPQFRPFTITRCRPHCGCSGSVCLGGRQGLVGAGKRRHNIFELRAALGTGL